MIYALTAPIFRLSLIREPLITFKYCMCLSCCWESVKSVIPFQKLGSHLDFHYLFNSQKTATPPKNQLSLGKKEFIIITGIHLSNKFKETIIEYILIHFWLFYQFSKNCHQRITSRWVRIYNYYRYTFIQYLLRNNCWDIQVGPCLMRNMQYKLEQYNYLTNSSKTTATKEFAFAW